MSSIAVLGDTEALGWYRSKFPRPQRYHPTQLFERWRRQRETTTLVLPSTVSLTVSNQPMDLSPRQTLDGQRPRVTYANLY